MDQFSTTIFDESPVISETMDDFPIITGSSSSPMITPNPSTNPTTSQPTLAPTYVTCNSNDALNIGFLLDESGSIDISE